MKIRFLQKPPLEELIADTEQKLEWFDDYREISRWWEFHGWTSVPWQILPVLGASVESEGKGIVAAWLYMDNSIGVCMMEWLVSSPEASPRDVIKAVGLLIEFLRAEALELGYTTMLTTCKQPLLAKLYEKNGFTRTDEGMIHLVASLGKESK